MKIVYRDKEWVLRGGITVRDAIRKVGLNPESTLATREGKLIHEATILEEEDVVRFIAVISGGNE